MFAPTNEAFAKLPAGTVDTLLKPENKDKLTSILTYHVVAGRLTTKDLREKIKEGGGKAELKTVEGAPLTVTEKDGKLVAHRRKGRHGRDHHRQRHAVERRHPGDQHRDVAGLSVHLNR